MYIENGLHQYLSVVFVLLFCYDGYWSWTELFRYRKWVDSSCANFLQDVI